MPSQFNRRKFLQGSVFSATGLWMSVGFGSKRTYAANEKLNLGIVGVANRGGDNLEGVSSQNIVVLCDTNDNYLADAKKRFTQADTLNDYRKLMERKDIEAVVVSTPDHNHAIATAMALRAGKHVYCEKPLTHTVYEARQIAKLAREHRRATQMGTQIHAENNYRRVVEIIQSGVIGDVREVHTWVGKTWSGKPRPSDMPPVPAHIHWNEWQGPAKERPYHPDYLPAKWRGYWDYGGGTLGDMACHHMDLPFWALELRHPTRISAEGPPVDPYFTPPWINVHYEFPKRGKLPPVTLHWYDGGKRPPQLSQPDTPDWAEQWGDGNLFVGDKGMLLADYGRYGFLPEKDFKGFKPPPQTIANSIGHYNEWIQACKTGSPTTCNFDYSGGLTETVLLGNVAYRVGKPIEWDAKRLRVTNAPEAEPLIRKAYRKGWGL